MPLAPRDANLGQVWTPADVADLMVGLVADHLPHGPRVLDPACGPGTFPVALQRRLSNDFHLTAFDVDKRMSVITKQVMGQLSINGEVHTEDYLRSLTKSTEFDLAILNPPYIRHEKLKDSDKVHYRKQSSEIIGETLDGRANLLVHFVVKSFEELRIGGILCAILYDAVLHTKYGKQVTKFLDERGSQLCQMKVATPFESVAIDATILVYRKAPTQKLQISTSKALRVGDATLGDLLDIRRGSSFPKRDFFLAQADDEYYEYATPILLKQRNVEGIYPREDSRAYLFKPEETNPWKDWLATNLSGAGYQEKQAVVKPIIGNIFFNYYFRSNPRHLWSTSKIAASDNFYVINSRNGFPVEVVWMLLNSSEVRERIQNRSRTQGGGLQKLQLFEYRNIAVPDWRVMEKSTLRASSVAAEKLIGSRASLEEVREKADDLISRFRRS